MRESGKCGTFPVNVPSSQASLVKTKQCNYLVLPPRERQVTRDAGHLLFADVERERDDDQDQHPEQDAEYDHQKQGALRPGAGSEQLLWKPHRHWHGRLKQESGVCDWRLKQQSGVCDWRLEQQSDVCDWRLKQQSGACDWRLEQESGVCDWRLKQQSGVCDWRLKQESGVFWLIAGAMYLR